MTVGLSCLHRRGGQSEIWPRWGSSGLCSPELGTRVGGPALRRLESWGVPGRCARECACLRLPTPRLPRRGSDRGAGACGRAAFAQWKREVSGGHGRFLGPARGLGTRAPRLRLRPGQALFASRPCWVNPDKGGAPSADPWASARCREAPSATSPTDPTTWCRLRGGAEVFSSCACARKEPF